MGVKNVEASPVYGRGGRGERMESVPEKGGCIGEIARGG